MIATVIIWIYIFIIIYLYGSATLGGLFRILRLDLNEPVELPLVLLVGIMAVTVVAMVANLLIPLGLVFVLVLSAGALVIAVQRRPFMSVAIPRYHPRLWIILVPIFLTILENATHTPSNPDTGFYHAQTVHWFETYRIVPGLGNLQERFAFNSAWLVLNASFSLAFLGLRSFHLMNGVLFLSVILFFVEGLSAWEQKGITLSSSIKIFFLPLSFYLLGSEISSLGNDMPVTFITWTILILWIEKLESPSDSHLKSVIIFLLSVFLVTLKLSSVLILCFALLVLAEYLVKGKGRLALILGAMGGLILLPWLSHSVILSGYLVFPLSQLNLFSVDWKMPEDQVATLTQTIVAFARVPGKDWASFLGLPLGQWAPIWFQLQSLNRQVIYLLVLVSPIVLAFSRLKYASIVSPKYVWAYLIAFSGSIFWFLSAPDIRFGYGFLVGTIALALSPPFVHWTTGLNTDRTVFPTIIFLFLIIFHFSTVWRSFEPFTFPQRMALPADYPPSKARDCEIIGAVIHCRKTEGQCQYAVFPCIPYPRPTVELRGSTFQDGFRVRP